MDFSTVTVQDRKDVEDAIIEAGITDCDLAFANLICWGDYYTAKICRVDGFIVIRLFYDNSIGWVYTFPLGKGDCSKVLQMIRGDAQARGIPFRLIGISEANLHYLRNLFPELGFYYLRSHSDYIYSREDLALLHGKKLQPKRNHVNKFKSRYDYSYSVLSVNDREECMDLLHRWRKKRLTESVVPDSFIEELDKEESSIIKAFDHFDDLGIIGGALRVENQMVAFCFGTAISRDEICVHIEKADETYEGSFPAINQLFAEHLPARFKFVNREDDLGLQGLRRAKESYHPVMLMHKYLGEELSAKMLQVKELWLDCFENDSSLDAEEFLLTRFREDMMLSRYSEDGRLISMLHIIPFETTAYLYAVATVPGYRHKGIAGELIREALTKAKALGFEQAALIPDDELAQKWYETMGFSGKHLARFNTQDELDFFATCDDYDYGKCDGTPDYFMIYSLIDDNQQAS